MNSRTRLLVLAMVLLPALTAVAETRTEKVHNEKVVVIEWKLAPGESPSLSEDHSSFLIYLDAGTITSPADGGKTQTQSVKRGDSLFHPPLLPPMKNGGTSDLRMVSIEFVGKESPETWGRTGLAPNYKLLLENQWARVYDIKIPAGATEPQHTHHDRVVVCLSGAELEHILPDGKKEVSSLKTDEIAWRLGATHIGHNLGKTDLWVIVIEPK